MKVIPKAEFARLTTAEIAHIDEVLQVTSIGVVIGYFVPPAIWLDLTRAEREREAMDDGEGE
jgi:hypothetical protein